MNTYTRRVIVAGSIVSLFFMGFSASSRAEDKSAKHDAQKEIKMNNSTLVLGTYFNLQNRDRLELKADGSFSIENGSLRKRGKFHIDDLDQITFNVWNGKIATGSFDGNVLTDPAGSEWFKTIGNKDLAGRYYDESNVAYYIELKKDGTFNALVTSTAKVNGTYKVGLYGITLAVHDPKGKHPDEEIDIQFGGKIPGRSHDVLIDDGAGIYFIRKIEQTIIEKYIQENSNGNNYVELMADGTFNFQVDQGLSNGIYVADGDSIYLLMLQKGRNCLPFVVHKKNNLITFEGSEEFNANRWRKQ